MQHGRDMLDAAAAVLQSMTNGDVPVDVVNSRSSGVDALLAASSSAAMVVVRRQARAALSRVVVGSTTSVVAAQADCPVVVVRSDVPEPAATAAVTVGVDSRGHSEGAVRAAAAEARWRSVPLVAVQAWETPLDSPPYTGYVPPDHLDREIAQRNAARSLSEALAGVGERYPGVTVRHRLLHGDPVDCLIHASHDAGLVVVGRHAGPHLASAGLGHVARSLIAAAACPVMVTPPER